MKINLFKKILTKVFPSFGEITTKLSIEESEQKEICAPDDCDPSDVVFAKAFTNEGGKFFYCDDMEDFYLMFKQLLTENKWKQSYCSNDELKNSLKPTELEFESDFRKADSSISNCEFLIACKGSVMVSAAQTKGLKVDQLPEILVIVAYTSQIVIDLNEGLQGLQKKYGRNRPSNVTSIRTKQSVTTGNIKKAKDLYVFLIEDYKDPR